MANSKKNASLPVPLDKVATAWIHCNNCFELHVHKRRRLFLLACDHIFCEQCAPPIPGPAPGSAPSYKCSFCKKQVRGRLLDNNMPKHLKDHFHPSPWREELPTVRILKFQQKHEKHYMEHLRRKDRALNTWRQGNEEIKLRLQQLFKEGEKLVQQRKRLERRARAIDAQRKRAEAEAARRRTAAAAAAAIARSDSSNSQPSTSYASRMRLMQRQQQITTTPAPRPQFMQSLPQLQSNTGASRGIGMGRGTRIPFIYSQRRRPQPEHIHTEEIQSFVTSRNDTFDL